MAVLDEGIFTDNGSTLDIKGEGVLVQCLFKGAFGGGVIDLEVSQDNGNTFYTTGDRFAADASFLTNPFKCVFKFTLSGATSPSISYVIGGV